MSVLKSILLIVYLIPIGSMAQFRIVGLLNVDNSKSHGNGLSTYQSNAQGRGFSVDEGLKKFLIRPKNIIRVHLIDDVRQSDLIHETDHILMIRSQEQKIQQPTDSVHSETNLIAKKSSKPEKLFYRPKRPQQRPAFQPNTKYQHKLNSVVPESVNRSPVHNPVQSIKHHKAIKRNQYKSRCRCERISNCPRIQISVTRCEPNYFLCCF